MPVVSDSENIEDSGKNIQVESSVSSTSSNSSELEMNRETKEKEEKPFLSVKSTDYEKLPRGSIYENSRHKSRHKKSIRVQKKPITKSKSMATGDNHENSHTKIGIRNSPRLKLRKNGNSNSNSTAFSSQNQNQTQNQHVSKIKVKITEQEISCCRKVITWKISQIRNQLDEVQEMTTSADAAPEFSHWNFPSTFHEIKHNVEFLQEETTRLKNMLCELQSKNTEGVEENSQMEVESSTTTETGTAAGTGTGKAESSLKSPGEKSRSKSAGSASSSSSSVISTEQLDLKFKSWTSLYKITLFIFDSNLSTFANSTSIDFTPYDKIHFNFTNSFKMSHLKLLRKFLQQSQIHKLNLNLYFIFNLQAVENIPSLFIFLQSVAAFSSKIKIVSLDLERVEDSSLALDLQPPWKNLSCPGLVHLTSLTVSSLETDAHIQWLCGFLNGAEKFNELTIGKPGSFPTGVFLENSEAPGNFNWNPLANSNPKPRKNLKRKRGQTQSVTTLRQLAVLSESANLRKASVSIFNLDLSSSSFLSSASLGSAGNLAGNSAAEDLNRLRMKYKSSLLNIQNLELSCDVTRENWNIFTRFLQTFHITLRGITGLKIHPDIEFEFSRRNANSKSGLKFPLFSFPLPCFSAESSTSSSRAMPALIPMPTLSSLTHLEIDSSAKWLFENLHHFPHLKKLFWRRISNENSPEALTSTMNALSNCKLVLRKMFLLWMVEPLKSEKLSEKILKKFSNCFPLLKQLILGVDQVDDASILWLKNDKNFPKLADLFITKFVKVEETAGDSLLAGGEENSKTTTKTPTLARYDLKKTRDEIQKIRREDLNQINIGVCFEICSLDQIQTILNETEEFSRLASQCDNLKTIFIPWIGSEITRKIARVLASQKSNWKKTQVQHVQLLIPSPQEGSSGNSSQDEEATENEDSNDLTEDFIKNEVASALSVKNGFDLDIRRVEASRMMTTPGFIIGKMDKRFWSRF